MVNNNEPIEETAPMIYTERKEGVKKEYDIRADRYEIAIAGMSAIERSQMARRQNANRPETKEEMSDQKTKVEMSDQKTKVDQSIQGTEQ